MHRLLVALLATLLVVPAAFARRHSGFNISISTGEWEDIAGCDQIRVRIGDEPAVRAEEQIDGAGLRSLKVTADHNGGVRVSGWDSPGYSITACKAAANAADLAAVHATLNGNELTAQGPDDVTMVYFIVRAPRGAVLDLHATNGALSVHNVEGSITATTENGPIAIKRSSGSISADADNGPISLLGDSGTVKLSAHNGPVTVKLSGATWNGTLDAHTDNGPLSLKVPRDYRSGVVVESDGHSPFACRAEACANQIRAARSRDDDDDDFWPRRVEIGSGPTVVRLSSNNGPVSVKNSD